MADSGSESIVIDAPPDRILEVVADIDSYPEWMPAFRKAEVTERDQEGRPKSATFQVDARLKIVNYTLEYSYPDDGVEWHKTAGDVEEITGSYRLEPAGGSTKVTYAYSIDPGFPVPGFLRKQAVKMMVTSALGDLKKRAEERV